MLADAGRSQSLVYLRMIERPHLLRRVVPGHVVKARLQYAVEKFGNAEAQSSLRETRSRSYHRPLDRQSDTGCQFPGDVVRQLHCSAPPRFSLC